MKIAPKLTLSFLVFSLTPLLISGILVFFSMRFYLRDQVERQLTTFADQKEQQLYQVANNKLEELAIYTNNLNLKILLNRYLDTRTPEDQIALYDLLLLEKQKNSNLNEIYLLDKDGTLITTTSLWTVDPNWQNRNFFTTAKTTNTASFIKIENQIEPQLLLAGPIVIQDNLQGIIVIDSNVSEILFLTRGAGQLGETAEVFLANENGPITPLKQNVPIDPNSLLAKSDRLVTERTRTTYPDAISYAGQNIIAVTRYIDVLNLSLITEISTTEAYLPIFEIFIILSTISLIITILAVVAAYQLARNLSLPILRLSSAASHIEKGNLGARVNYQGKDEFGVLALIFNDMAESIQKADQTKREFISLASHQLRTPLSAIKWSIELLFDKKTGHLNPKQTDQLTNISDSTTRMTALVNSLLDVSRIEGNKIKLRPQLVDLSLLVKDVLTDLNPRISEKKLRVETILPSLPKINLDIQLIDEVYRNLLSNSIKYSLPGNRIALTISREKDHILTQIADTGVGIAKKDFKRVFKKFFRGKNAVALDPEGSGLGLFLVKTIIESNGGKIWFESKLNKGTTFYFTLPIK